MLLALSLSAADLKFPPIDGELSGDFTPLKLPGAPPLHWTVTLRSEGEKSRAADIVIQGAGTRLHAAGRLDADDNGTWRLIESEIDIGPWIAALMPAVDATLVGFKATGSARATAEGTWRNGVFGGHAIVSLRDGKIDDPLHKLLLEGVAFDFIFDDLVARCTAPAQRITWTSGRYDVVALGGGSIVFTAVGDRVQVESAALTAFGGQLALAAFSFTLAQPEMELEARVTGADIADLLPLLPPVLAEARGRLDGTMKLRRTAAGVQIGAGRLSLRRGESAQIRLAPTPGLLSGSLPPTVLKYYPGLGKIETGEIPLQAELLEVVFTPEGDAEGRTASVHLAGGPVDPKLRAPIDLTINVRGPLESLIKFGTDSRLHFGGGP